MNPARLILPALRWDRSSGFATVEREASHALDLGVGGFIIFGGTASSVAALTDDLTRRAGRPLLFAADLERGAGQQFTGLTEIPPPAALGILADATVARQAGRLTAQEASSIGINLVLAPVADVDLEPANPIVQSRSFGTDPALVARMVAAWVDGCQSAHVTACLKHFPGHGRTTTDSHAGLPTVDATAAELETRDLLPFRAGIEAGAGAVMTAHVRFEAFDDEAPATFSSAILGRLRGALGFDGVIVTDALNMAGARRHGGPGEAAVAAVRAGVDLLLYPEQLDEAVSALQDAVERGTISRAHLAASEQRYRRALVAPHAAPPEPGGPAWAESLAQKLLADGVVGAPLESLEGPIEGVVIDDDLGGPYPPGPTDRIPRTLASMAGGHPPNSRVLLVFAEPRGWKERAGLSEATRKQIGDALPGASLVVLFGHPRLVEQIPGDLPVLVAWHRQPLMQDAVVRWLEKQLR